MNKLKQWRALATRYEKRAASYRAVVVVASILIWVGMCCVRSGYTVLQIPERTNLLILE